MPIGSTNKIIAPEAGKPITSKFLKAIADATLNRIVGPGVKRVGGNVVVGRASSVQSGFTLAQIEDNDYLIDATSDIWKYKWSSLGITSHLGDLLDTDVVTTGTTGGHYAGGIDTADDDYAINLCEILNTTNILIGGDGIDPTANSYPGAFNRQPVGEKSDGSLFNCPVMMFFVTERGGKTRPCFYYQNAHNGDCDEDVGGTP